MGKGTSVYLEVGKRRVFACSLDWPGWCRAGKTEESALEALAAYIPRYSVVTEKAGISFPLDAADTFDIVERLPGSQKTDFGAPGEFATSDGEPLTADQARRQAALVEAAWDVFDRVAGGAPAELRKGPRGGGRDRDKIIDHVIGADAAYARKLGVKHRQPSSDDAAAIGRLRAAIISVLDAPSDGTPLTPKGWPPRYAARRIAWHALDHAWEIEDRTTPD